MSHEVQFALSSCRRGALASLAVSAVVSFFGASAFAQASGAEKAAADALFDDAKKLMKADKYAEACPKLEESYKLSQRLGTLLNLATCHEKAGKTASAWAEFKEAVALAKKEKSSEREKLARKSADSLESKLARLEIVLPADAKDWSVELDGTSLGGAALGTALPIDPGAHRVKVSGPGKKPFEQEVQIAASAGTTRLKVPALEAESSPAKREAAEPARVPEKPPKPEPAPSGKGSSTLGWVAVGVGVVGVGVGSYFGLRALSKKSDSNDHCGSAIGRSDPNQCDAAGADLRDQAQSAATLSTISFGVGAVGLGVGIVLLATSGGSKGESSARPPVRSLFVAPAYVQGGGQATVGGTF